MAKRFTKLTGDRFQRRRWEGSVIPIHDKADGWDTSPPPPGLDAAVYPIRGNQGVQSTRTHRVPGGSPLNPHHLALQAWTYHMSRPRAPPMGPLREARSRTMLYPDAVSSRGRLNNRARG